MLRTLRSLARTLLTLSTLGLAACGVVATRPDAGDAPTDAVDGPVDGPDAPSDAVDAPVDAQVDASDAADASRDAVDAPTEVAVTIAIGGTGAGRITGPGIDCSTSCTVMVAPGRLALTATASVGSAFAQWTGTGCGAAAVCEVGVVGAVTITATFSDLPTLRVVTILPVGVVGDGVVLVDGQLCSDDCSYDLPLAGGTPSLSAQASDCVAFDHWVGACTGTSPTCTPLVTADTTATAVFRARSLCVPQ